MKNSYRLILVVFFLGAIGLFLGDIHAAVTSPFVQTTFVPRYQNRIYPEQLSIIPVGNGIADDTRALQFAINYAIAHAPATLVLNRNYRITRMLIIQQAKNLDIGGTGTIRNSGAVTANGTIRPNGSGIFIIRNGSETIRIANLRLIGSWSAAQVSTGSADGPGIVIGNFVNDGMKTNRVIVIENNILEKFNYSGIMIVGQTTETNPPLANQYVLIQNNHISNSSNGVFAYKNAEGITITKNHIVNTAYDGIALDTAAASVQRVADAIASISISKVRITDNLVEKIGSQHSSIGILLKGLINDAVILRNVIREVRAPIKQVYVVNGKSYPMSIAYGISVGPDAHQQSGRDVIISLNDISILNAELTKNGLVVGGYTNVIVQGNKLSAMSNGLCMRYIDVPSLKFYGNQMNGCEFQTEKSAILISQKKNKSYELQFTSNSYNGKMLVGNERIKYGLIP